VDREQGLAVIRGVVADSLGLDPREVKEESRIVTDLGADSLDIIDLVFTLERRFGLKLRDAQVDALLRGELFTPDGVVDGFLRSEVVDELARILPALAQVEDRARVAPGKVVSLITIETLWVLVERKLAKARV
jgi:acyl carrier protein